MRARAVVAILTTALTVVALGAAPPAAADDATAAQDQRVADAVSQLDGLAAGLLARTGVPGLAVGVVYKGQLLKAAGYGVRDVDTKAPVTPDTVFQLASVSKSVGASVVAAAVGRGIVTWQDPVVSHLPWFRLSDPYVTRTATIGDMYAMRSGLPGQAGDVLESVGYDRREILARLRTLPLDPFRISYAYTNFGLTTGAEATAAAAGKSWAALSRDLIYGPLGMTSTSSRYADFVAQPNRATLHVPVDGQWVTRYERHPGAQSPAGGVSSNVLDMSRWLSMELAAGWFDGQQVVQSLALAKAQSPQVRRSAVHSAAALPEFYGYGMNVKVANDGRVHLSHSGAFSAGAGTTYLMVPELELGIVVLSNALAGVPEALAQSFVDLATTGEIQRDWQAFFGPIFASFYAPDTLERPTRPAAPRADSAYVGTYANGFWGDVRVLSGRGGLRMVVGPDEVVIPLTPWDGDTFRAVLSAGDVPTVFTASFSGSPRVSALTLDLGPSQDGDLLRVSR